MSEDRSVPITRRQREVLDELSAHGAFTRNTAHGVGGIDAIVAENLVEKGVLNKRYTAQDHTAYWVRRDGESPTGTTVPAGFLVILSGRDLATPSGRQENFFLARAPYDGRSQTFRRLLRGWMSELNLRPRDLLYGTWGVEVLAPDAPVFDGDHVILGKEVSS